MGERSITKQRPPHMADEEEDYDQYGEEEFHDDGEYRAPEGWYRAGTPQPGNDYERFSNGPGQRVQTDSEWVRMVHITPTERDADSVLLRLRAMGETFYASVPVWRAGQKTNARAVVGFSNEQCFTIDDGEPVPHNHRRRDFYLSPTPNCFAFVVPVRECTADLALGISKHIESVFDISKIIQGAIKLDIIRPNSDVDFGHFEAQQDLRVPPRHPDILLRSHGRELWWPFRLPFRVFAPCASDGTPVGLDSFLRLVQTQPFAKYLYAFNAEDPANGARSVGEEDAYLPPPKHVSFYEYHFQDWASLLSYEKEWPLFAHTGSDDGDDSDDTSQPRNQQLDPDLVHFFRTRALRAHDKARAVREETGESFTMWAETPPRVMNEISRWM